MTDEIKKVAIVKEVNISQVERQLKQQEESYVRNKKDLDERISVADKLTDDEKERVFGQELKRLENTKNSLDKGKEYLKDVKEAEPVEEIEKGKKVKGENNKPLKNAI